MDELTPLEFKLPSEEETRKRLTSAFKGEIDYERVNGYGKLNIADAHYYMLIGLAHLLEYFIDTYGYPPIQSSDSH